MLPPEAQALDKEIVKIRQERSGLTDEAWVKRIVADSTLEAEGPQKEWFNKMLLEEVHLMPDFGKADHRDKRDPVVEFRDENGDPAPSDYVYACGLRWWVGEHLGGGAFGQVYEVAHRGPTDRRRVVKFMTFREGEDPSQRREMLHNEISAALAAGDFVGSETIRREDGSVWVAMIMERHEGRTAKDVLIENREQGKEGYRDSKEAYKIALATRAILAGLRKMHASGWVHADVKPANIILNEIDGEETLSRMIDMGLAERKGAVRVEADESLRGTPRYMLPEQISSHDVDLRLRDYWALVVSVGEILGLFKPKKITGGIYQIFGATAQGRYFEAPNLFNQEYAEAEFQNRGIEGSLREFVQWLYDFVRPHDDRHKRQEFWREAGITKKLVKEVKTHRGLTKDIEGDFIDDEKFVKELEGHIRALAHQAEMSSPDEALALLQEFPPESEMES